MGAAAADVVRLAALGLLLGFAGACTQAPVPDIVVGRPGAQQPLLEQSRWTIFSVNGRETPGGDGYTMRFVDGQLTARFGCNFLGGPYRIERGMLTAWDLSQTLMGCPEPAGSFERQGAAILREPMQVARDPITGGPLLSNRNGRISLVPIVTGTRL